MEGIRISMRKLSLEDGKGVFSRTGRIETRCVMSPRFNLYMRELNARVTGIGVVLKRSGEDRE